MAGYHKEKSWAYPNLCQQIDDMLCTCVVCHARVLKEEESWTYPHLCQQIDDLYLCCISCQGTQEGGELDLPPPVSTDR